MLLHTKFTSIFTYPVIITGLLLTIAGAVPVSAQTTNDANDGTVLKQIILFGRHSIRSSTFSTNTLNLFSAEPYPVFEGVSVGYLTPRGRQAEALFGAYFHDYLIHEGLLTGDAPSDLSKSYFRANSIQRSYMTAAMFGSGLIPGQTIPVHSYTIANPAQSIASEPDPVFDPVATKVATVDSVRALTEVQGAFGNGPSIQSACSGELALISNVLYPPGTQPTPGSAQGAVDPTLLPITFTNYPLVSNAGGGVNLGNLNPTAAAIDPFVMQYTDGFPLEDVAWGRLSPATLSQQTRLTTLQLSLVMRPPYLARVQSSNAGSHVMRSLNQAAQNVDLRGAFGNAQSRVVVVISSDAYVLGLAGLLNLHWTLPGYQPDYCAPGGALVFELRQVKKTKEQIVRVFYTAQTFDQLRNLTPLTLAQPPATMQLLIPGASKSATNLDVSFAVFKRVFSAAIDPGCVQSFRKEVPPGVLDPNSVPLN
jgi:4-phytase / acid phosphatase